MQNQKGNMSVAVSFIIVVGIIVLVIYALLNKGSDNGGEPVGEVINTENNTLNQEDQSKTSTNTKTMERTAKVGDTLIMNYTGRLIDGTVFDSNVDAKFNHVQPFTFVLGAGQVIAGWDEGLVGMKVGEKKTLTIPPEKAYGNRAIGSIPANSTLIFDVELVGIK